MTTYLFRGLIKPAHVDQREAVRPEHIAYQGSLSSLAGGPLLDDHGEAIGTMAIFDAPDRGTAEARVLADPYITHGVVSSWSLDVFVPVEWTALQ